MKTSEVLDKIIVMVLSKHRENVLKFQMKKGLN